jgi:hypothetical protein
MFASICPNGHEVILHVESDVQIGRRDFAEINQTQMMPVVYLP